MPSIYRNLFRSSEFRLFALIWTFLAIFVLISVKQEENREKGCTKITIDDVFKAVIFGPIIFYVYLPIVSWRSLKRIQNLVVWKK